MSEFSRDTGRGMRRGRGRRTGRPFRRGNSSGRTPTRGNFSNFTSSRQQTQCQPPSRSPPPRMDFEDTGDAGQRHTSLAGRGNYQDQGHGVPNTGDGVFYTQGEKHRQEQNMPHRQYSQHDWSSKCYSEHMLGDSSGGAGQGYQELTDPLEHCHGDDELSDEDGGNHNHRYRGRGRPLKYRNKHKHASGESSDSEHEMVAPQVDTVDVKHCREEAALSETGKSRPVQRQRHKPGSGVHERSRPPTSQDSKKSHRHDVGDHRGKHGVAPDKNTDDKCLSERTKPARGRRKSAGEESQPDAESSYQDTKSSEETSSKRPSQNMPVAMGKIFLRSLKEVVSQPESHVSPIDGRNTPTVLRSQLSDQQGADSKEKAPSSGRSSPCVPSEGTAVPAEPCVYQTSAKSSSHVKQRLPEKVPCSTWSQNDDDCRSHAHNDIHGNKAGTTRNAAVGYNDNVRPGSQSKSHPAPVKSKSVTRLAPESKDGTKQSVEFANLNTNTDSNRHTVRDSRCSRKEVKTLTAPEVRSADGTHKSDLCRPNADNRSSQQSVRSNTDKRSVSSQQSVRSNTYKRSVSSQRSVRSNTDNRSVSSQQSVRSNTDNTKQNPILCSQNSGSSKGRSGQTSMVNSHVPPTPENTPSKRKKNNRRRRKKSSAKNKTSNSQPRITNAGPKQNLNFDDNKTYASDQRQAKCADLTEQQKGNPRTNAAPGMNIKVEECRGGAVGSTSSSRVGTVACIDKGSVDCKRLPSSHYQVDPKQNLDFDGHSSFAKSDKFLNAEMKYRPCIKYGSEQQKGRPRTDVAQSAGLTEQQKGRPRTDVAQSAGLTEQQKGRPRTDVAQSAGLTEQQKGRPRTDVAQSAGLTEQQKGRPRTDVAQSAGLTEQQKGRPRTDVAQSADLTEQQKGKPRTDSTQRRNDKVKELHGPRRNTSSARGGTSGRMDKGKVDCKRSPSPRYTCEQLPSGRYRVDSSHRQRETDSGRRTSNNADNSGWYKGPINSTCYNRGQYDSRDTTSNRADNSTSYNKGQYDGTGRSSNRADNSTSYNKGQYDGTGRSSNRADNSTSYNKGQYDGTGRTSNRADNSTSYSKGQYDGTDRTSNQADNSTSYNKGQYDGTDRTSNRADNSTSYNKGQYDGTDRTSNRADNSTSYSKGQYDGTGRTSNQADNSASYNKGQYDGTDRTSNRADNSTSYNKGQYDGTGRTSNRADNSASYNKGQSNSGGRTSNNAGNSRWYNNGQCDGGGRTSSSADNSLCYNKDQMNSGGRTSSSADSSMSYNEGQSDSRGRTSSSADNSMSYNIGHYDGTGRTSNSADNSTHYDKELNSGYRTSNSADNSTSYNKGQSDSRGRTSSSADNSAWYDEGQYERCSDVQQSAISCSESWDLSDNQGPDVPSRFGTLDASCLPEPIYDNDSLHKSQSEGNESKPGAFTETRTLKKSFENEDSYMQRTQSGNQRSENKWCRSQAVTHGACSAWNTEPRKTSQDIRDAVLSTSLDQCPSKLDFVENLSGHAAKSHGQTVAADRDRGSTVDSKSPTEDYQLKVDNFVSCFTSSAIVKQKINALYPQLDTQEARPSSVQESQLSVQECRPSIQECRPSLQEHQSSVQECRPSIQECRPSLQEHQSSVQECRPSVQECRPSIQECRLSVQERQSLVQECRPLVQECRPSIQECRPLVQEHQPSVQESRPSVQEGQLSVQQCPPSVQESQPSVQEHQPLVQEGQLLVQERPPSVQESQPSVQEHQPLVQEGQLLVQEHQPLVQERQLSVQERPPSVQECRSLVQECRLSVQERQTSDGDACQTSPYKEPFSVDDHCVSSHGFSKSHDRWRTQRHGRYNKPNGRAPPGVCASVSSTNSTKDNSNNTESHVSPCVSNDSRVSSTAHTGEEASVNTSHVTQTTRNSSPPMYDGPPLMNVSDQGGTRAYDGYLLKNGRSGEVPQDDVPMCCLDERGSGFPDHSLPHHDDCGSHTSSGCESLPYPRDHAMTSPSCRTAPQWNGRRNDPVNFHDLAANIPPPPLPRNQGMQNNSRYINPSQHNKRKQCDSESGQKRRGPYVGHPGSFSEDENPRQYPNPPLAGRRNSRSPQSLPPRLQRIKRGDSDHGYGPRDHPNPSQRGNQNYSQRGNQNYSQRGNQNHSQRGNLHHSQRGNPHHSQRGNPHHSQRGNPHHSQRGNPHHSQRGNDSEAEMVSRDNYQGYGPDGHPNQSPLGNLQWRHPNMPQQEFHREYDVDNMPGGYDQNLPDFATYKPPQVRSADLPEYKTLLVSSADLPEYKPPLVPSADLPEYNPPPIPSPDHPEYKTNPALRGDTKIGNGSCSENGSEDVEYGGENLPNSPSVFDVGYEEQLLCYSFELKTEKGDSKDTNTNSPVTNRGSQTSAGNVVSEATTPDRPSELRTENGETVDDNANSPLTDIESQKDTRDASNTPDRATQSVPSTVDAAKPSEPVIADIVGDGCWDITASQTVLSTADTTDPDMAYIVADCCQGLINEEESESAETEDPGSRGYYEHGWYMPPAVTSNDRREYTPPYTGSAPSINTDMYFDRKETEPQTVPHVVSAPGVQRSPGVGSEKVGEIQWRPPKIIDFSLSYPSEETWRQPPVSIPPQPVYVPQQSGDILCEESWSAEIKGHDYTPFGESTSGTNCNIVSQQELFCETQKYGGTDSVNQSSDGEETKMDSVDVGSSNIRNVIEGSGTKGVDAQTDTEGSPADANNRQVIVHEANTERDFEVPASDMRKVMRRTQSDSTLAGKENNNRNTPDRPAFRKKMVQDGTELILTAKEPPSNQRRNTSNRGRHSLDGGVFATLERIKKDGSFRGNQQLAVTSENSQNSSVQPDWFDFPDQHQNAGFVFTPPISNNYNYEGQQNRFSVLASLDDNSSTTDSEASPNVNLKGQRRRTRWSDPLPPRTDCMTQEEEQPWQRDFRNYYNRVQTVYFDTHCHIDFIFKRSQFVGSYEKYRMVNKWTYPDTYAGCLAVFCDPRTFRKQGVWKDILADPTVWGAVGCHPKSATDFDSLARQNLVEMLKEKKVKAVGEIGLDYSGTFHQHKDKQIEVFRDQIQIALDIKFPIVIHSRDAEDDCLRILREMVPSTYRIHRHCFTGCWAEADEWLRYFPESYIGLTPLITHSGGRSIAPRDVARHIPLDRLLLETDAPYFVPRKVPRETMALSHPGMAVTVAAEVAYLKGIDIEEVLTHCLHNSEKMYGITINKTRGAHWSTHTQ